MADGSVPITAGSGTNIRAVTNAGVQSGAYQQVFSVAGQDGVLVPTDPDGTLQVSPEPTSLFLDDYSGTLSTNWTLGGTAVPTASGGNATLATGTTSNASSFMRTVGNFMLRASTYLYNAFIVQHEAAAVSNNIRWWGYGAHQTTPTYSAPILNGAVFMLDGSNSGVLQAAIYSGGTKTVIATLTRFTDAAQHRYEIRYRQSIVYWVIDGTMVASRAFPNLAVATNMPIIAGSFNAATAPGSSPVMVVSSASVSDLGGNNRTISDGTNPYIQATVKAASTAAAATDVPLVVAMHPTSPVPPGTATSSLGKIRSLGSNASDVGVASMGVRAPSTPAAGATSAGAYEPILLDVEGKMIVAGTGDSAQSWQAAVSVASTSQTLLKASAGSGIRNYVTDMVITSTVTTVTVVTIQDGSTTLGIYAVSSTAPVSINLSTPLRGTAATAVNISLSAANQVYVSATGYSGI